MKIRIYQINLKRDVNKRAFMGLAYHGSSVESEIYDCVFDGEISREIAARQYNELESVFAYFNYTPLARKTFRSISVSDVVEVVESEKTAPGFYFCDNFGWVKLSGFDPNKTVFLRAAPKTPTEKQSLWAALGEAREYSRKFPEETYYVMDKKSVHSRVISQPWLLKEMRLTGWQLVAIFINGERVE